MPEDNFEPLTVLELDDLYYRWREQGCSLADLKRLRIAQEQKLRELPVVEQRRMTKQIRDRYVNNLVASSAKHMLHFNKKSL